ncbi:SpoIIE family protein phosphatase [Parvibium lacunae]|nr:SpoIIE family protein phosphatase [Parvibium lacunae]
MPMPPRPTVSLRVLIADDNNFGRLMLKECLEKSGHHAILAEDGQQALELFETEHPDVVLLDVVMPRMDGFEAARRIRQHSRGQHTPLLFLSALDDQASKIEGLTYADGYIEKPIQFDMLLARLNSFFRQIHINRQLNQQKMASEAALQQLEEETEMGAYVLSRILASARAPDDLVQYLVSPASRFSGDVVLYEHSPQQEIYILLADAVGHGISAALNVFPLFQVFMSMVRKGLPLLEIVEEMNQTLCAIMPVDRFVSAIVLHIHPPTRSVTLWNGGCPPVLLLDEHGTIQRQMPPECPPLRLADREMIRHSIQTLTLEASQNLILFSDGLVEIGRRPASEGLSLIQQTLHGSRDGTRFDKLVNYLQAPGEGLTAHDDVSIVVVRGAQLNLSTKC